MTTIATAAATIGQHWQDGPHEDSGFPFFILPVLWLLVIAGVVTAVVAGRRRRDRDAGRRAGERVLAERFAAGEIDDATYQARLTVLRSSKR